MDFFEHQDSARRKTFRLVLYFAVSVLTVVACVYLAVLFVVHTIGWKPESSQGGWTWWRLELLLPAAAGTLAVILAGSIYKTVALASGGHVVAETLGGRLLNRSTKNRDERILLNVVDEMAIASGVPSPPVFVLDKEQGINAFAAGYQTDDAVIGVTKGCIQWLSRDELQGVIAHEFSHILNGDMRLNMRLVGLLHGILLLALTGYWVTRSTRGGGAKGRGGAIILMGLALLVIGYVGVFFAKLIKAAVSRQREYLADASAVQFTRNPAGIAGALIKIGGLEQGATINNSQAEQASHMFLGNAVERSFFNLISTHPPLEERIRRIIPSFDGRCPKAQRPQRSRDDIRPLLGIQAGNASGSEAATRRTGQWTDKVPFQRNNALARIGNPVIATADPVEGQQATISIKLQEIVQNPFAARAIIYGLLLDQQDAIRIKQLARLEQSADPATLREVRKSYSELDKLDPEARLPLVKLAAPALCQMSRKQYAAFCSDVKRLISADMEVRLFEFLLWRMLLIHLAPQFGPKNQRRKKHLATTATLSASADLLAGLAHVGHAVRDDAKRAFEKSMRTLNKPLPPQVLEDFPDKLNLVIADRALGQLSNATLSDKKRVMQACAVCIDSDGIATIEGVQLLRVIAESLRCPMPPIVR